MTKQQAIQIFNNADATRDDLRNALAFALGVESAKAGKPATLFAECRDIFLNTYRKHTNAGYYFAAKDAGALKQVILKIEHLNGSNEADLTKSTFEAMIINLPAWYRNNAFSLTIINSKFNEIVADIKRHGKKDQGVSDDYLQRKIDILNS